MRFSKYSFKTDILLSICLLFPFIQNSIATKPGRHSKRANPNPAPSRKLPPCQSCRILANSFRSGLERTAKGHYGGGDTAWEEDNKKVYENSELRFVEIQEGICGELSEEKDQCLELVSENEHHLEEWWGTGRTQGEDLMTWLCINKLQVCCPDNHYGPNCLPCPGYPGEICSGHGKCKGNGTRKGNGECSCFSEYSGKICNSCAPNYYEAYKDIDKLLCSACHKACYGGCSGAGAKNCAACKEGWEIDEDLGCIDLNECLLEMEPCKKNEFCVNAEGSYKCIECDRSCDGCFGDGPDMCEKCASGFMLQDKMCLDGSTADRNFQINTTRYLTYFGLCVATCIIFQKNIVIASVIGMAVAVYITASEYLLNKSQL